MAAKPWSEIRGYPSQTTFARRLRKYGITLAQFSQTLKRQGGRCAICRQDRELHIDHDHLTGRFRGLLCVRCNSGLGLADDDPARLRRAADYLGAGS